MAKRMKLTLVRGGNFSWDFSTTPTPPVALPHTRWRELRKGSGLCPHLPPPILLLKLGAQVLQAFERLGSS